MRCGTGKGPASMQYQFKGDPRAWREAYEKQHPFSFVEWRPGGVNPVGERILQEEAQSDAVRAEIPHEREHERPTRERRPCPDCDATGNCPICLGRGVNQYTGKPCKCSPQLLCSRCDGSGRIVAG